VLRAHRWFSLLLLLLVAAWSQARAAETDRGLIWRIDSKPHPSYLVGSLHMAPPELHPLPASVTDAFAQTEALVVEADMLALPPTRLATLMNRYGVYPPGESVRDELHPELWKALQSLLEHYDLPPGMALQQKPWLLSATLAQVALMKQGYRPELGLDLHFLRAAKERSMTVLELENIEFQLGLFDRLAPELQRQMLEHTVTELLAGTAPLAEFADAWSRGDDELILKLVDDEFGRDTPLRLTLLDQRNDQMTRKLLTWLGEGRSLFIVVGAGHLVGERGLVTQLRDAGYRLERL